MTEIPPGISFEETDSGFVLRQNVSGKITEIRMTLEEFDGLKATIDLWRDRRLSGYRVGGGGEVRPIVVHPVATAGLWPDAIGANILLNVQSPSGAHMTLSLPPEVASTMVQALPDVLAMIANPRKQ